MLAIPLFIQAILGFSRQSDTANGSGGYLRIPSDQIVGPCTQIMQHLALCIEEICPRRHESADCYKVIARRRPLNVMHRTFLQRKIQLESKIEFEAVYTIVPYCLSRGTWYKNLHRRTFLHKGIVPAQKTL